MRTQNQIETNYKSNRKPYNDRAGYIASRHSLTNGGWIVIYEAALQGLDIDGGKYAVVCETHNTILQTTSLPKARPLLKYPDFCEECMRTRHDLFKVRVEFKEGNGFEEVGVYSTKEEAIRAEKRMKTFNPYKTEVTTV